ncbi:MULTISPECIES: KEOPS complex subunit Cgi121 [Halobacterium]|uniref:KEOPS complex subunit Cgi121 n=5 Tax=Halobacterium salinarum TaxID=2242 RepID=A0A510N920_HALSA|nr:MULTISPECIES: KEOPS complex subunit Cgi121 [Halobacterium]MBB6089603.1 KEOPS complex subunit Cgi121 [Halobacterium salinarum]MCF2164351.1 KEOPS complex subunit Cgi121 [Halobacterium salinarum]MCF2167138.1 KEOPS complex subunit Cgi121 [Halobacterium salinarum]MCF2207787.1 KEOPS complex subunit Cgi121 [Halobacterium salinarum]MCF2239083.1 KEOPS complex subunit Cgi121 [Halobacterium salinarum]
MRIVEGVAVVEDVDAFVASLGAVGDEHGVAVQAFDAAYVAGREHVESAVTHAARAFDRGANVADERAVEILLYAAGRRQIRRALDMGVDEGRQPVCVVVAGGGDEAAAADAVAAMLASVEPVVGAASEPAVLRAFFDVSEAEMAAVDGSLAGVVRERVALLDVEK